MIFKLSFDRGRHNELWTPSTAEATIESFLKFPYNLVNDVAFGRQLTMVHGGLGGRSRQDNLVTTV